MTELQLGKYEFYPNEKGKSLEDLILTKDDQKRTEDKFLEAARRYLAEKDAKRKKKLSNRKTSHRR